MEQKIDQDRVDVPRKAYHYSEWNEVRMVLRDPNLKPKVEKERKRFNRYRKTYELDGDTIARVKGEKRVIVIETKEEIVDSIWKFHNQVHGGRVVTEKAISMSFYFHNMRGMIMDTVSIFQLLFNLSDSFAFINFNLYL